MAKEGKVLEQKNYCSLSWEPLRDLKWVKLFVFPQVHLRRSTLVRTLGGMLVGRPVRVAGCKLAVADVGRDHGLLSDHDVHGDEVTLEGLDAAVAVMLGVAPVVLEEEERLRLNLTSVSPLMMLMVDDISRCNVDTWKIGSSK